MTPIPRPHIRMRSSRPATAPAAEPAPRGGPTAPPEGAAIVLALGSNLGDSAAILRAAAEDLARLDGLELTGISPVHTSAAVKLHGVDPNAPRYLNAVLTARYTGTPYELLEAVNEIEAAHGRVRTERWGDRTLDIDIIIIEGVVLSDDRLTLPHPRAAEREFVLAPWLELDPAAQLPGYGPVADLLAALRRAGGSAAPPEGSSR